MRHVVNLKIKFVKHIANYLRDERLKFDLFQYIKEYYRFLIELTGDFFVELKINSDYNLLSNEVKNINKQRYIDSFLS